MNESSPKPVTTILTPRLASARAHARPIPLVEPVIRAAILARSLILRQVDRSEHKYID